MNNTKAYSIICIKYIFNQPVLKDLTRLIIKVGNNSIDDKITILLIIKSFIKFNFFCTIKFKKLKLKNLPGTRPFSEVINHKVISNSNPNLYVKQN